MVDDDASARRERLSQANGRAVAKMLRRYDDDRTMLYRDHVRATVEFASPILIDAIRMAGMTPADLVRRMMPPAGWPDANIDLRGTQAPLDLGGMLGKVHHSALRDPVFEWRFARGGVVLRTQSDPAGALAVRVSGDTLDGVIDVGDVRMVLEAGRGRLRLAHLLPSTLLLGMVGQELSCLADHPALSRTGCVIRSVSIPNEGQLPVVSFDCGLEPIDLFGMDDRDVG